MPNPFAIDVGNPLQGLGNIAQAYGQKQQQEKQLQAQQAKQQEAQDVLASGDVSLMASFMAANPQMAKGLEASFQFKDDATRKNMADSAFRILQGEDKDTVIRDRAAFVSQSGGSPAQTLEGLDDTPEETMQSARIMLAQYGTPEQIKAVSDLGLAGVTKETKVGAQEILEDGTVIQSTGKGVKVFSPTGELVTGQAAADTIRTARAEKVSNLRKAAGEKKLATLEAQNELEGEVQAGIISQKEAANASIAAFDKIEAINEKIGLYDEGIRLIDEGAGTGRIEKMFPSFKTASIKLDNLANRLGLDVVSNTTFGALSAGELAMAMSTALPTSLDGPELKEWMIEKRDVQQKLADYLESAAIYLGTPGNTKVGWLKKKKIDRRQAKQAQEQNKAPQGAIDYLLANPQAAEQFKAKFGYLPEGL